MRRAAVLAFFVIFAAASAAAATGPSPGVMQGGDGVARAEISYDTVFGGETTLAVRRDGEVVRSVKLRGDWGIPLVTFGQAGGLSHDGRTLVLAQGDPPRAALRTSSRFLVLDTRHLSARQARIALRGDFSFDALSPHGRVLYLIQHVSTRDLTRYRVRAYDLAKRRLLPRVIADKRQASWTMRGYPMARATGPGGRWEYTLYSQGGNYPFVHALDTVTRTAVCIGIPWDWTKEMAPIGMTLEHGKLRIELGPRAKRFVLDTRTLRLQESAVSTK
jgi:hypothetical protein